MNENELLLPSTLLYYIISNSTAALQIKISQTSKSMNTLVHKIRIYSLDELHVLRDEKYGRKSVIKFGYNPKAILAHINVVNYIQICNKITVKSNIVFGNLKMEDFALFKNKIDNSHLRFLSFRSSEINLSILNDFRDFPVQELSISGCIFKDNDEIDVLCYALKNMKKMIGVHFHWQNGITSLEDAANIKRDIRLTSCTIGNIEFLACPKLPGKFVKSQMTSDGKLVLEYSLDAIPKEYKDEIKLEMPDELQIQIGYSDDYFFIDTQGNIRAEYNQT